MEVIDLLIERLFSLFIVNRFPHRYHMLRVVVLHLKGKFSLQLNFYDLIISLNSDLFRYFVKIKKNCTLFTHSTAVAD